MRITNRLMESSNYLTVLHSSHTLAKKCSKFSKPGFSNTWTMNFQMFKLDLEKAEEPEIKLSTSVGSEKARVPEKHLLLLYWLCKSLWLCGSQKDCGKFLKRWKYQITWPASWEICMQIQKGTVKTGHGTTDWFQVGKGVWQGFISSPCLFNL